MTSRPPFAMVQEDPAPGHKCCGGCAGDRAVVEAAIRFVEARNKRIASNIGIAPYLQSVRALVAAVEARKAAKP